MRKRSKLHFSKLILAWYKINKRDLPFRENPANPYYIWISEIILQQTHIHQGLPYYFKFINKYPNLQTLASANEQDILNLWQGLGYYSRARNLHATAKYIANELKGVFPNNYRELIRLKGIGPYTAAAISSICFKEPIIALDGNSYRFISRFFGIQENIDKSSGKKKVFEIGQKHISRSIPGDFNQAIIEIGALICKPASPLCHDCPVSKACVAFNQDLIDLIPVRKKKIKPKNIYLYYFYIRNREGEILFNKRTQNDIWKNLFDLPLLKSEKKIALKQIPESNFWKELFKDTNPNITSISKGYKHVLSHQILKARFYMVEVDSHNNFDKSYLRVHPNDIADYPIPRLIDKFFQHNL